LPVSVGVEVMVAAGGADRDRVIPIHDPSARIAASAAADAIII
jgi:hypothetical protein